LMKKMRSKEIVAKNKCLIGYKCQRSLRAAVISE
jgi:hypothetical protein